MSDDNNFSLGDILWEYADYTPPETPAAPPVTPQNAPKPAPKQPVMPSPQPVSPAAPAAPVKPTAQPAKPAAQPYLPANQPLPANQAPAQPKPAQAKPAAVPPAAAPVQTVPQPAANQPGQPSAPQPAQGPAQGSAPPQAAQPAPTQGPAPAQQGPQAPVQGPQPQGTPSPGDGQAPGQPAQPQGETAEGQSPQQGLPEDDGPDLIAFTPDPKAKQEQAAAQGQQPQPDGAQPQGPQPQAGPQTPPGAQAQQAGTQSAAAAGWKEFFGSDAARMGQRDRKPRSAPEAPPDALPSQLAEEFANSLPSLGVRSVGSAICTGLLLLLSLLDSSLFPVLDSLLPGKLMLPIGLGLFVLCVLMSFDQLKAGLIQLTNKAPNGDTLALFATAFTLADGITLLVSKLRTETLPFFAPCALMLTFHLVGQYCTQSYRFQACQTASSVNQPYVVTQDMNVLGGQSAFRKWIGVPRGFGSQIRTISDGEFRFQRLTPVLIVACVCLSMITTVAHHQPKLAFWSLSALFTASATLGVSLSLSLPMHILGKKLAKLGVALAGWPGVQGGQGCKGVMLHDYDIYPPGTISLAGGKVFGSYSMERTVSFAASVIRASGSGLTYLFDKILRSEGGSYMVVEKITMQENGLIGESQGQQILVGNSDFMSRMGVALPTGIKAKDAVFCAVGGEAIGMFALKYALHATILPSLRALFAHKLHPILITRDFNLNPQRLRLRGRLPVDQITFPDLQRRVTLSGPNQVHSPTIVAVLCREGLPPFSRAVIGAKRIHRAARFNSLFVNVSACVGVFLTATLSSAGALGAMCAWNLSMFLLLWLVPILLLSLWAAQY